jgi:hypothetical protein
MSSNLFIIINTYFNFNFNLSRYENAVGPHKAVCNSCLRVLEINFFLNIYPEHKDILCMIFSESEAYYSASDHSDEDIDDWAQ